MEHVKTTVKTAERKLVEDDTVCLSVTCTRHTGQCCGYSLFTRLIVCVQVNFLIITPNINRPHAAFMHLVSLIQVFKTLRILTYSIGTLNSGI